MSQSAKPLVMKWRLVLQATRDPQITKADLAVFAAVLDRMDASLMAFPGLSTIATDARINRSSVVRSISRLDKLGYLIRKPGNRLKSNEYTIDPHRCSDAPTPRDADAPTPRCNSQPELGASRDIQLGAPVHPEPAFKSNLKKQLIGASGKNPRGDPALLGKHLDEVMMMMSTQSRDSTGGGTALPAREAQTQEAKEDRRQHIETENNSGVARGD